MSFIIDNRKRTYFYNFSRRTGRDSLEKNQWDRSEALQQRQSISIHIKQAFKLKQLSFTSSTLSPGCTATTVGTFEISPTLSAAVTLAEGRDGDLSIRLAAFSSSQRYIMVETPENRILMSRTMALGRALPWKSPFKVGVNLFNGQLTLSLPPFLLDSAVLGTAAVLRRVSMLHRLINETLGEARVLLEWLLHKVPRNPQIFEKIDRLRQMMSVFRRTSEGVEVMSEKTIRDYKMREAQSVKRLVADKASLPGHFLHSLMPFHLLQFSLGVKSEEDCQWTSYESDSLKKLIIPSRKICQEAHFSSLLSHILINNPEQIKIIRQIGAGGFSSIFMAEIEFCFVDPGQYKQKGVNTSKKKPMRNVFVIKKDTFQSPTSKKMSKNTHERAIVQKLKNSTSALLNRYYQPVNGSSNDILMDYIPFPTLKEYLLLSRQSISLQTKLFLMVSVLLGVRSLAHCDVVHLDLKPNNIMLGPELLIKLLDFGESYHPDVKTKPGNTVPYTSPEAHSSADHYTVKSDLYSFGVIIFELLYGRHPFAMHLNKNIERYRTGEYLEHWLYAPEQTYLMGDSRIYNCLNQLVSRCLEVEPSRRPEVMAVGLLLLACLRGAECA